MATSRKEIVEALKSNAPMVFGITMTTDMGYEFSAIVEGGVIYPEVGMLLYTEEKGHIPDWWDDDDIGDYELQKRKNIFLEQLDVVPWKDISTADLEEISAEVKESED